MKYIRQEHIITTVCKEDLNEIPVIKTLMENLMKEGLTFSISIKKPQNDIFSKTHIMSYDKTRIQAVTADDFDISVFTKTVHVNMKNIKFENIVELKVITSKSKLVELKDDLTRFDLIDIEKQQ